MTPAETNLSAQDPVCGMSVDTSHPRGGTHIHAGTTYYFCNPGCRETFKADPDRYLARPSEGLITIGAARPRPPVPPQVASPSAPPGSRMEYICPMDPEIVRDRPGACPKCGMALEPRTIRLDEGPNPELIDMTRRFWVSVVVGFPVVALPAADLLFPRGAAGADARHQPDLGQRGHGLQLGVGDCQFAPPSDPAPVTPRRRPA